jgi:hypothetical protein
MSGKPLITKHNPNAKNKYLEAKMVIHKFVDHADFGEQMELDCQWMQDKYPELAEHIRIDFMDNYELVYRMIKHD